MKSVNLSWLKGMHSHAISFSDQILVSGGNFLTIVLCAQFLSLEDQGKFIYVFSSYVAAQLINIAGIYQGAAVRAPVMPKSYQDSLALLQLSFASFFVAINAFFWFYLGNFFNWQPSLGDTCLVAVFLLLQQMADFSRRISYIFSSPKRAILFSLCVYPLRIGLLLIYRPASLEAVLYILIATIVVPAFFALKSAVQNTSKVLESLGVQVIPHLKDSLFYLYCAPLGWLWSYLPLFFLSAVSGKEEVAILASIRSIANAANLFLEQVESRNVADWAKALQNNAHDEIKKSITTILKVATVLGMLVLAILLFWGQYIVQIALGSKYESYWLILPITWLAYGSYFVVRLVGVKYRVLGDNKIEYVGYFYGVFSALIAGLFLIPEFGIYGAAWIYVLTPFAAFIGQRYYLLKIG
jgi:O-antigen/teichoic acid export membrane protein